MPDLPGILEIETLMARVHLRVRERCGGDDVAMERAPTPAAGWSLQMHFGKAGNAATWLRSGFSAPEGEATWTDGTNATLELPLPTSESDILLSCFVVPHLCGGVPAQNTRVTLNGRLLALWEISKAGCYNAILFSHHVPRHQPALLSFDIPDAFSPVSRGISGDSRVLGLALRTIQLKPFTTG